MPTRSFITNTVGIAYTLRVSSRAKYVRLKMSPYEGLVVVVPQGYDKTLVPSLVESRKAWVLKVQRSFEKQRKESSVPAASALPDVIGLAGIGESWRISYRHEPRPGIQVRECDGCVLELAGSVDDRAWCMASIEGWLKRRAQSRLAPELIRLAAEHGFTVSGVTVRKQKSRWGSCSSRGNINLNLKLLFLPPLLVRYIMIHELCHTLHMNHSSRYWNTVARYDPDHEEHDRLMRHAWRHVPAWLARAEPA
ncbi:MAG: M48 family metallopeptidase [Chlorobiaceae bacterium]|nr:M48 family metallopeptidase [Chlorobiaceae bacterium]